MFDFNFGLKVDDDPNHPPVKIGDKLRLVDYSFTTPNEAVKLSKLEQVTVSDVDKHPIGKKGKYHWEYSVWLEESDYIVCPHEYDRTKINK